MATYDLRRSSREEFVVHFGGRPGQVDAFTFANALLGLSEALREINAAVNPDSSIEIVIDGVGPGSFRTRIRTVTKKLPSLLKSGFVNVVLPVALWYMTDRVIGEDEIVITTHHDHYVVERGEDRIILSKEAYLARREIKDPARIDSHISNAFEAIEQDRSVTEFEVLGELQDDEPIVRFPRSDFARLSSPPVFQRDDDTVRVEYERADLVIVRAIFRKSRRRWQFVYRGFEISAPVSDSAFHDRVEQRQVSFRKGTMLDAKLRITKVRDPETGVFLNDPDGYEVVEVYEVVDGPRQQPLFVRD